MPGSHTRSQQPSSHPRKPIWALLSIHGHSMSRPLPHGHTRLLCASARTSPSSSDTPVLRGTRHVQSAKKSEGTVVIGAPPAARCAQKLPLDKQGTPLSSTPLEAPIGLASPSPPDHGDIKDACNGTSGGSCTVHSSTRSQGSSATPSSRSTRSTSRYFPVVDTPRQLNQSTPSQDIGLADTLTDSRHTFRRDPCGDLVSVTRCASG